MVVSWVAAGRLMHFPRLDASGWAVPLYSIGWRIEDNPDVWTNRFLSFKAGNKPDVFGGAAVLREALQELVGVKGLVPKKTGLCTALGHAVANADPNSVLSKVGKGLANNLDLPWLPDAFEKDAHRSLRSLSGGAAARDGEVANKYRCRKIDAIDTLIILDDFATRGATLGDMVRALRIENPKLTVAALVLGKNERAAFAGQWGINVNNDHIPKQWDALWQEASKKAS